MKRTILVAALLITALSVCIAGQTSKQNSGKDEKAKNEVLALADVYFKALVKMDAETIDRILSDDYTKIESYDVASKDVRLNGVPIGKDFLLTGFRGTSPDGPRLEAIDMDEIFKSVRVYGETAVLVTKITLKWKGSREELAKKYKFMPKTDDFIVTLVAVKKNGVWQVVSTHQSEFKLESRIIPNPN